MIFNMNIHLTNDIINGIFEIVGGILNWINVLKLYKDKQIKGVYYPAWIFFAAWGMWNIWYYSSLGQWFSFTGGLVIVSANVAWVIMAIYFMNKYKKGEI